MIAIGCDHGGFALKNDIINWFKANDIAYKDFGTHNTDSINYAPIGAAVARSVASGECERGILVCSTGIGMSMTANKIKGIRAAVCSDHYSVKYTRLHNDANVLCLGAKVIGPGVALEMVDIFLNTAFEGGRHAIRIGEIAKIENGEM